MKKWVQKKPVLVNAPTLTKQASTVESHNVILFS